jgi:sugar-specific transcriptional regulator TrmB
MNPMKEINSVLEDKLLGMGLSAIQAKIYLTLLNMGHGQLMPIARKVGIIHTTVRVNLGQLEKKMLVFGDYVGKHKVYSVQSPNHGIRMYLQHLRDNLTDIEKSALEVIDGFQMQYNNLDDKPEVRFIQGKEVLPTLQQEVLHSSFDVLYELTNLDSSYKLVPRKRGDHRSQFRRLKRRSKSIYSCIKGAILPFKDKGLLTYFIPSDKFDFDADIVILGDKVVVADMTEENYVGVIIKNKKIANAMKKLFDLAIEGSEKYQPPHK